MQCEKCGNKKFETLIVVKDIGGLFVNPYTGDESEVHNITIKCLECGHEFEECV